MHCIEYSTDFRFFLQEQIGVSSTNGGRQVHFFSRLEKRSFKTVSSAKPLLDSEIKQYCLQIFNDLVRIRKPEDFSVRHIYYECSDRLNAIKMLQGEEEETIEIQLNRHGNSTIFSVRKYVDVKMVNDVTFRAHNWCQAYQYAKSYLNFMARAETNQ